MKRGNFGIAFACLALGGCVDPLVGLAIEVGGRALIAGVDAATSNTGSPDVEAYCWDPEKQSASTSTSPNCWSPQVKITEDEYDKFKESGVPPMINASLVANAAPAQRFCANPQGTYFYTLTYGSQCASGDTDLPEAEWHKRHAQQSEKAQIAASAPLYCWDPDLALEYETASKSCGNDHRITEEQYQRQRARREETEKARSSQQAAKPAPAVIEKPASPEASKQDELVEQPRAAEPVATPEPKPQAAIAPREIDLSAFDIPGSGTGFFVSAAGHLLTNEHVVAGCDAVATIAAGGFYEAGIINTHKKFDLAVLSLPFGVDRFASFAAAAPEQGDDVFVVGYPLLGDFREIKITDGIVSGLSGPDHDTSLLQTTAAVQPGNSGGPLINANGSVVGVVVGKYTGEIGRGFYAEGINFAVSQDAAAAFLSANGVVIKRSNASKELKGREVMRRAGSWTVPLLCLTKKSAG